MSLNQNSCVMVTGAGSGIGFAAAGALIQNGYTVFGGAIDQSEADRITGAYGDRCRPVIIDVRKENSVEKAKEQVNQELSGRPLVALLNIAGVITNGPLMDLTESRFQQILMVNVVGIHTVTRAFVPLLRKHKASRVINLSSASGTRTMPFTGAYSASKFGVEALSTAMRYEFSALGIKVVVIAPAMIKTPMVDDIQKELKKTTSMAEYEKPLQEFLKRTVKSAQKAIPMEKITACIIKAIETKKPARRYELHNNYIQDALLMRALPAGITEKIILKTLGL